LPTCPECGGHMFYDRGVKLYVCRSCGCSMNQQQLLEEREKRRARKEKEERDRKRREEYIEWWLSAKK